MKYLEKTFSVGYGGQAYRDGWEATDWSDGEELPECQKEQTLEVEPVITQSTHDWCDGADFFSCSRAKAARREAERTNTNYESKKCVCAEEHKLVIAVCPT